MATKVNLIPEEVSNPSGSCQYPISIWDKIEVETPYHALCNAGHISYMELDASPVHNLEAFCMILEAMRRADMGYAAANFPLDICRDCGANGLIDRVCPRCGSANISRVRITGYLSDVANFNDAKRAELAARRSSGRGVGVEVPEVRGDDLRLAGIARDSVTDGPGVRLVVFAQGCQRRCPGCHNPETWSFDGDRVTASDKVITITRGLAKRRLTGVTLSGGEPFCQAAPLAKVARVAKEMGLSNLEVYTMCRCHAASRSGALSPPRAWPPPAAGSQSGWPTSRWPWRPSRRTSVLVKNESRRLF